MSELETLRNGFVAFIDGLWWGLRDSVGALSIHEGYASGFKQMGLEEAKKVGVKGAEEAAEIAFKLFSAIGLKAKHEGKEILIESCPLWDRILERGLEYAFHIEEICWKPMLQGIGEIADAEPHIESALRTIHLERAKVEYKKKKAKAAHEKGVLSKEEYDNQVASLEQTLEKTPNVGRYRFD